MGKVKIPVCGSGFLAVIKNKTGKYNIVMAANILYTKGVKQNHHVRIVYPAEGKCPLDRY